MKLKNPIQVKIEDDEKVEDQIKKIAFALSQNDLQFWKGLNNLNFDDNFKAYSRTVSVDHENTHTFRHQLGSKPGFWVIHGGSRIDNVEEITSNSRQLKLKFYLSSSVLTAAVVANTDIYVVNPYAFKANDTLIIGGSEYTVSSVDNDNRKVVLTANVTASQFALVKLKSEETTGFQAQVTPIADNNMVQDINAHDFTGLDQPLG